MSNWSLLVFSQHFFIMGILCSFVSEQFYIRLSCSWVCLLLCCTRWIYLQLQNSRSLAFSWLSDHVIGHGIYSAFSFCVTRPYCILPTCPGYVLWLYAVPSELTANGSDSTFLACATGQNTGCSVVSIVKALKHRELGLCREKSTRFVFCVCFGYSREPTDIRCFCKPVTKWTIKNGHKHVHRDKHRDVLRLPAKVVTVSFSSIHWGTANVTTLGSQLPSFYLPSGWELWVWEECGIGCLSLHLVSAAFWVANQSGAVTGEDWQGEVS